MQTCILDGAKQKSLGIHEVNLVILTHQMDSHIF